MRTVLATNVYSWQPKMIIIIIIITKNIIEITIKMTQVTIILQLCFETTIKNMVTSSL